MSMRTKYPGVCFRCHLPVPTGKGDLQSIRSLPKEVQMLYRGQNKSFVVRCFGCKQKGNVPLSHPNHINRET